MPQSSGVGLAPVFKEDSFLDVIKDNMFIV